MDLYFLDIFKKLSASNSLTIVSTQQYYNKCILFADYLKQDAEKWREYVKNAVDKYNENPISSAQKI